MKSTVHFVFLTALRDRLFVSLIGLMVLTFAAAVYLGSAAVAEKQAMTAVYVGGGARVILVLGLIVFTSFHVERLYETREIEALLSRAISRESFVFSYWLGIALLALIFILPLAGVVLYFSLTWQGAVYWLLGVALESLIVIAFVMFAALSLERAVPTVFVSTGFYALARLAGFFTGIASAGKQDGVNAVANPIIEAIGYIAPRLDLVGQTRWLVYGPEGFSVVAVIIIQAMIYVPLLLCAAMFDLRRKHF